MFTNIIFEFNFSVVDCLTTWTGQSLCVICFRTREESKLIHAYEIYISNVEEK